MTPNEEGRLAHALNDLRPDWPIASLRTFIARHLTNRTWRDAAIMLVWVATDLNSDGQPATSTPKRVLENGPWKQAAAVAGTTALRAAPPRKDQECGIHAGQWSTSCSGCRVDALADDRADVSPDLPPLSDRDPSLAARLARITNKETPA